MKRLSSLAAALAIMLIALGVLLPELDATSSDPVILINPFSLEEYKPDSPSQGQAIMPIIENRIAGIDGTARSALALSARVVANPFATAQRAPLTTGNFEMREVDIALPGKGFVWTVGRSYNGAQRSAGQRYSSPGYQGTNWFQVSHPELVAFDSGTGNEAEDLLYVIFGADQFSEYRRVDATSTRFVGVNGCSGIIEFLASSGTFVLTDQYGKKFEFFDHDTSVAPGQFWRCTDPAGNMAYVGHATDSTLALAQGFDSSGRMSTAFDTNGRRYTYTYTDNHLSSVVAEKPGPSWVEVARVEYSYYAESDPHGSNGDLMTVRSRSYLAGNASDVWLNTYYRYYKGSGAEHLLKLIMHEEGCRNFDFGFDAGNGPDQLFDESYKSATDQQLKAYSTAFLQYDSVGRLSEAAIDGDCACASSPGGGIEAITYELNTMHPANAAEYDHEWHQRVIVSRKDDLGVEYRNQVYYYDEIGQPLSQVIRSGSDFWATKVTRNAVNGAVSTFGSPQSVAGYDHATGQLTDAATGHVTHFGRVGLGPTKGFVQDISVSDGAAATPTIIRSFGYVSSSILKADVSIIRPFVASTSSYQGTTPITTTYQWALHSGTLAVSEVVTTNPTVSANGPGAPTTSSAYFAPSGEQLFSKSEDGRISYYSYSDGLLTFSVRDANTMDSSIVVPIPPGFASNGNGAELHSRIDYSYDEQGRIVQFQEAGSPQKRVSRSFLKDHRLVTLRYADYEEVLGTDTYYGPVGYEVVNHAGSTELTARVEMAGDSTQLAVESHIDETSIDPLVSVAGLGSLKLIVQRSFDPIGRRVVSEKTFHNVPAALSLATRELHFDETTYDYDDYGRLSQTTVAAGSSHQTITEVRYDVRGHIVEQLTGTDSDAATGNMTATHIYEFDAAVSGGNGWLTKATMKTSDLTPGRSIEYIHDFRGRVIGQRNSIAPHYAHAYDNAGNLTSSGQYSVLSATPDPTISANRIGYVTFDFDSMNREYRRRQYEVDQLSGSLSSSLKTERWYDARGRVAKIHGVRLEKYEFDRLGRRTNLYSIAETDDADYQAALNVQGDHVLAQARTAYDSAGRPVLRVSTTRHHDDAATTGRLDGDNGLLAHPGTVSGRAGISAIWYDRFGRKENEAHYGTNDGISLNRAGLAVPGRPNSIQLTTIEYSRSGVATKVINAEGRVKYTDYDDALRITQQIQNHDPTSGGGQPVAPDINQVTTYAYTDGLRTSVAVDLVGSASDQITQYVYGTTKGAAQNESSVASGHLLRQIVYPDSSGAQDRITMAWNAQGELVYSKDQQSVEKSYARDSLGRITQVSATAIPSGVDSFVDTIKVSYGDRGFMTSVEQWGSGVQRDDSRVKRNNWGELESIELDYDSAYGGATAFAVGYSYENSTGAGRRTRRRTQMTYPSGDALRYVYSGGLFADRSSRVDSVELVKSSGVTTLASYTYQGPEATVKTSYPEPKVYHALFDPNGDLARIDKLDRVTRYVWSRDLSPTFSKDANFYDVEYVHGSADQVLVMQDKVHAGWDVVLTHDGLYRATRAEAGEFNGQKIINRSWDEQWDYNLGDQVVEGRLDLNGNLVYGDTAGEFQDTRTYSKANELLTRTEPASTLVHDSRHNTTDDGNRFQYEYDVFSRVRRVKDRVSGAVVQEYRYNGFGSLVAKLVDEKGNGTLNDDVWFYSVHDADNRRIALYRDDDSAALPKQQWYHHQDGLSGSTRNPMSVIGTERDTDTAWSKPANGVDVRYYFAQNPPNVVAVIRSDGQLEEWDKYFLGGVPYGLPAYDVNSDSEVTAKDVDAVAKLIGTTIDDAKYDVRADCNLDGHIDSHDLSLASTKYIGQKLGRWELSLTGNDLGSCGRQTLSDVFGIYDNSLVDPETNVTRNQGYPLGQVEDPTDPPTGTGGPMLQEFITCQVVVIYLDNGVEGHTEYFKFLADKANTDLGGEGEPTKASTAQEFLDAIPTGEDTPIWRLIVIGHGLPRRFDMGEKGQDSSDLVKKDTNINKKSRKKDVAGSFAALDIHWCVPCDIVLLVCFAARNGGMNEQFAKVTPCSVYSPVGKCFVDGVRTTPGGTVTQHAPAVFDASGGWVRHWRRAGENNGIGRERVGDTVRTPWMLPWNEAGIDQ